MIFQNVTNDNFNMLKQHLTTSIANALKMPSSSIKCELHSGSNRRAKRSASKVGIILMVLTTKKDDSSRIKSLINSESFKKSFNEIVITSDILKNAGVVLNTVDYSATTVNTGNFVF